MTIACLIASLIVGLLLSIEAGASDSCLCIAAETTGFHFDRSRKAWKSADLRSEKNIGRGAGRRKHPSPGYRQVQAAPTELHSS